jgi:hypothetical protein
MILKVNNHLPNNLHVVKALGLGNLAANLPKNLNHCIMAGQTRTRTCQPVGFAAFG